MPMVLGQSVQHLMAERMTLRHAGVLEVVLTIMRHAQLRHDTPGLMVSSNRVRNDLREVELVKPEQDCSLSSFRRVTLTPICSCNPPADLDRRREVGVVTDWEQANGAQKGTIGLPLNCP